MVLTTLGKYRVESELGRGAFGIVYRAQDTMIDSPVALKVFASHLLQDPVFIERFKREARLARSLNHPNIVVIYELGFEQGMSYLAMQLVEGNALDKVLAQTKSLPLARVIRIAGQIAYALDYAHSKDVIHRDIKPSNILIGTDDHVTLTDFGLARAATSSMLTSGAVIGTPAYMSPEQADGEDSTASSDLYSLGITVYEMLTGQLPFKGEKTAAILYAIINKPAPAPSTVNPRVPPDFDPVLLQMLSKSPTERFADGAGFVHALVDAVDAPARFANGAGFGHASVDVVDALAPFADSADFGLALVDAVNAPARRAEQARLKRDQDAQDKRDAEAERIADAKARQDAEAKRLAEEKARQDAIQRAQEQIERKAQRQPDEQTRIERERRAQELAKQRNKWMTGIITLGLAIIGVCFLGWLGSNLGTWFTTTAIPPTATRVSIPTPIPATVAPLVTATPRAGDSRAFTPDNAPMQYVPAGGFTMGSDSGYADEKPVHTVYLDPFWMDKYEVTNALYKKCVDVGKCTMPSSTRSYTRDAYFGNPQYDNYPVISVNWEQAKAYCEWAGKRLPTEAEWEKSARGTDARVYPWGNTFDKNLLNSSDGGKGDTTAVGSYSGGASPYGVMDLAGNVWEWVADWYGSYASGTQRNPTGSETYRVLRGGAWGNYSSLTRAGNRNYFTPSASYFNLGFRCVRSN